MTTDIATIIEAAGTGMGGAVILLGTLWKPIVKRHDERKALSLFLTGTPASPGIKAVPPAGDRLVGVESGLRIANETLGGHTEALAGLAQAVKELMTEVRVSAVQATAAAAAAAAGAMAGIQGIAAQVTDVAHEVHSNTGGSMKDSTDRIEAEQVRVAEEHLVERKIP